MQDSRAKILAFWFEETKPAQWYMKNDDFDAQIIARFAGDYDLAMKGIYDGWLDDEEGCLALCLLLDQFPRNMFRGTSKMFASDEKALSVARHVLGKGFDRLVSPTQRTFLYLPFEHSENMDDQKRSVALFEAMKDESPVTYDYALRHLKVIEEFGRFPHRNGVLGRQSTKAEEEYLAQGGGF